jgi:hypothetical protein
METKLKSDKNSKNKKDFEVIKLETELLEPSYIS